RATSIFFVSSTTRHTISKCDWSSDVCSADLISSSSDSSTAVDESELLEMEDQNHDQETFLAGKTTPVMFASAVLNFGIHKLLDKIGRASCRERVKGKSDSRSLQRK